MLGSCNSNNNMACNSCDVLCLCLPLDVIMCCMLSFSLLVPGLSFPYPLAAYTIHTLVLWNKPTVCSDSGCSHLHSHHPIPSASLHFTSACACTDNSNPNSFHMFCCAQGTAYANNSAAAIKTKVYHVMSSVKYGYILAPLVMGQLTARAISRGGAQVLLYCGIAVLLGVGGVRMFVFGYDGYDVLMGCCLAQASGSCLARDILGMCHMLISWCGLVESPAPDTSLHTIMVFATPLQEHLESNIISPPAHTCPTQVIQVNQHLLAV